MRRAGEQVAGVIIEPVQDLDIGPVLKAPVDEVRLPHLVWLRHLKPRVGGPWALSGLRADQLQGIQAALSITDQEAMEMPAGDPELGRSRGDRQPLGNDLENSDTRSGHTRDCPPTPGQ